MSNLVHVKSQNGRKRFAYNRYFIYTVWSYNFNRGILNTGYFEAWWNHKYLVIIFRFFVLLEFCYYIKFNKILTIKVKFQANSNKDKKYFDSLFVVVFSKKCYPFFNNINHNILLRTILNKKFVDKCDY